MTNINLSQSIQPKKVSGGKNRIMDRGTLVSLLILILALLALGGVKIYAYNVENKIRETEALIVSESDRINNEDVNRIADFQNRLEKVDANISAKKNSNDILDKIGNVIMEKSYITSFNYNSENGTVSMAIVSNGIEEVAKQTLSFKESPYFKKDKVSAFGDYAEDEDGKVRYNATLVLSEEEADLEKK